MLPFALNHMTVARLSFAALIDMARSLNCVGVELRNDLDVPLFDDLSPADAGRRLRDHGMRLLALAELKAFNDWNAGKEAEARRLIAMAHAAGAEAITLIPRNDNGGLGNGERQGSLRIALRALHPMLQDAGLVGFIEPLGFDTCSLRQKTEAVTAIDALNAGSTFRLIHDTFHHHLAEEEPFFPAHTGLMHISGVTDPRLGARDMADGHRTMVDTRDRLGNCDQIAGLLRGGYQGPISFEIFATEFHALPDPAAAIKESMEFISAQIHANTE